MENRDNIQLYEDKKVRTVWDEEKECWWFSVVDVVAVLTDSTNPTDYLKKMRKRDELLADYLGTNCPQVEMIGESGKRRKVLAANIEQLFRIIQSIPSPKAEPFKRWLATVGAERIEETIDPEQAIDRALETYQRKGYSDEWIQQRLMSIKVRNALTDEWQKSGVQKGREYAILTDEITKAWSDMTTRQYKNLKGLKKENLRDNMSDMELILNMLAESTATNISKKEKPDSFERSKDIANRGGKVAKKARLDVYHHLIVCEVDGKIVASCVCVIIPNLTRSVRPYAFVENVVTHGEYRKKGYATACLNFAKKIAEENNCYKMVLLTGSKKESTLNFYQNAGYNSSDKTAFIQWIDM